MNAGWGGLTKWVVVFLIVYVLIVLLMPYEADR